MITLRDYCFADRVSEAVVFSLDEQNKYLGQAGWIGNCMFVCVSDDNFVEGGFLRYCEKN